ncbi:MAG: hypothetical protein Q4G49_03720 [Paracoccus sp. (in: a-proteobacteria)]|nr:hypothetical protein [Paracoccus sp. (in: a-proteobacteria)]
MLKSVALALALCFGGAALAGEAGDAVFAERGPWALGDRVLNWQMTVDGPEAQGFASVSDGAVRMAEIADPSGGGRMLQLTVQAGPDGPDRKIGPFPLSTGDPALIYFLEQTVRDMSSLTGGSPFYIQNRIKEALFNGGRIDRDGDRRIAVFSPFADDPNAARMHGFQTLTLTFVLTGDNDPIRRMTAETGPLESGAPYRADLVLQ